MGSLEPHDLTSAHTLGHGKSRNFIKGVCGETLKAWETVLIITVISLALKLHLYYVDVSNFCDYSKHFAFNVSQ